jgi:hypothetical protein
MRTASVIMLSGLFVQAAHAAEDEIRRSTFPNVVLGTWAETAQQCAAKDKSNVVIEPAKYGDGDGSCAVSSIVESQGSSGINYAVRALCTSASLPEKDPNRQYHRANAWPRSRANGTSLYALCRKRVRRFKEISALSITIAPSPLPAALVCRGIGRLVIVGATVR